MPSWSFASSRIPAPAPDHLDDVPAGAEEGGLQFLDDLAVAAHRSVQALQVAIDHEHQVVQAFAYRHGQLAHRLRLVHLAVAAEHPHLAVGGRGQATVLHVADEARLVDGHHWPQPHRNSGELPEIRHQPWMRIRGQSTAANLVPEVAQSVLAQAPLEEGARVDAGRAVSLDEHHVTGVFTGCTTPEVIEADLVQGGRGGIAGKVSAVLGGFLVGLLHHGHGVPADICLQPLLDGPVAGIVRLLVHRNGVHVRGVRLERQPRTGTTCPVDQAFDQEMRAITTPGANHRVDGLEPFAGLFRILILSVLDFSHCPAFAALPNREKCQ